MYTKKALRKISQFEAFRHKGACEIGVDIFAQNQGLGAAPVMLGRSKEVRDVSAPLEQGPVYAIEHTELDGTTTVMPASKTQKRSGK